MKLLHTSDWHIGQQLFGYDRIAEHRYFFDQLAKIVDSEKPDIMVVSGDVFHVSTPSADALRLFVEGMLDVCSRHTSMRTFVTAGNHDSAMRLEADKTLWRDKNVEIVGVFPRTESGDLAPEQFVKKVDGTAIVAAVPFVSPRFANFAKLYERIDEEVRRINEDGLPVIYMSHTTAGSAEEWRGGNGDDEIGGVDFTPLKDLGAEYDYLALGHIHMPQSIKGSQGKARYCGSPIAVSFDETHPHGVDIVTVEHGSLPDVATISIKQKREVLTLPREAAPFSEAIKTLQSLPPEREDYIRLNVLVDNFLSQDCQNQVDEIVKDKKCRFCQIMTTRKENANTGSKKSFTLSEFQEIKPIDIARLEYKRKTGEEMTADIAELLKTVIEEAENNE